MLIWSPSASKYSRWAPVCVQLLGAKPPLSCLAPQGLLDPIPCLGQDSSRTFPEFWVVPCKHFLVPSSWRLELFQSEKGDQRSSRTALSILESSWRRHGRWYPLPPLLWPSMQNRRRDIYCIPSHIRNMCLHYRSTPSHTHLQYNSCKNVISFCITVVYVQ